MNRFEQKPSWYLGIYVYDRKMSFKTSIIMLWGVGYCQIGNSILLGSLKLECGGVTACMSRVVCKALGVNRKHLVISYQTNITVSSRNELLEPTQIKFHAVWLIKNVLNICMQKALIKNLGILHFAKFTCSGFVLNITITKDRCIHCSKKLNLNYAVVLVSFSSTE